MTAAPGCFGFPSIFSFKSAVCRSCPFINDCEKDVESRLKSRADDPKMKIALQAHQRARSGLSEVAVSDDVHSEEKPLKRAVMRPRKCERIELSEEQKRKIESAPKKVAKVASMFWSKGFSYDGSNPFNEVANRTYHAAFKTLAAAKSMTKKELRMSLMNELNWSETSAYAEVSVVWSLFPLLGVSSLSDDGLRMDVIDIEHPNHDDYNPFHRFPQVSHD